MNDQAAITENEAGATDADAAGICWQTSSSAVPYPDAVDSMQGHVAAIRAGAEPERVWLLEHPPLFTAGTSAKPEDLFNPLGFPAYDAGRGGQWTYHGPGQRIAYVMLDLHRAHGTVPARDVRAFVGGLEGWLIRTLADFGVRGELRQGRVGVWVADPATGQDRKIAALGVRLTRWVSWHGVSLNIAPNLDHFDGIVPCGIREHGVTSLQALGSPAGTEEVDQALRRNWSACFG